MCKSNCTRYHVEWLILNIVYVILIELDLPPLKLRRQYLKLTTLHGILYNYSYFPVNIFNFNNSPYTSNRNLNLIKPIVRTNYFLHSFVPNSVVLWNSLPFSLPIDYFYLFF